MDPVIVARTLKTWARRLLKAVFFILLSIAIARLQGNPEGWVSYHFADKVATYIYIDVNAETIYDACFYISFVIVIFITITIYILVIKLINYIWKQSL